MGSTKAREIQNSDILRMEAEINNLWGELNTSNIPHSKRIELESTLSSCEKEFKRVLSGEASVDKLEADLKTCDFELAEVVIHQAQNEISKAAHESRSFLALEAIGQKLKDGEITPVKARHEVKDVMRHNL